MRPRHLAPALVALAALVAVPAAGGKDGVRATLATRIDLDAPAGTPLRVAWRLIAVDEQGRRRPFGAGGVFVRLRSAGGGAAEEGFAPARAGETGRYEATVVVPEGGIGDVEIGLMGWQSGPDGTKRGDMLFPIANDPLPGPAHRVAAGSSGPPGWVVGAAGAVVALAIAGATVVLGRSRRRRARAALAQ